MSCVRGIALCSVTTRTTVTKASASQLPFQKVAPSSSGATGRVVDLSELKVAWFHQPSPDVLLDSNRTLMAHLRRQSFSVAHDWTLENLTVPWLNHPRSVYTASSKARQLQVAKHCGLQIPDTLITNSTDDVRSFCNGHKDRIIVKNLATPWYIEQGKTVAALYEAI